MVLRRVGFDSGWRFLVHMTLAPRALVGCLLSAVLAAGCPGTNGDDGDAGPPPPTLYDAGPLVFPDAGPAADAGPGDAGPINTAVQVLSLSPSRASTAGGLRVTIEGVGLSPDTTCLFGDVAATNCIALDSTRMRCEVPPQTADGFVNVRCENDRGAGELEGGFLYFYPVGIDSITPSQGAAEGGEAVTVRGLGFNADMMVLIGGRRAVNLQINEDGTEATCITPPGTPGRQDVLAIDAFSRSSLRLGYTYRAALSVDQVVPAVAEVGSVVEVRGAGFVEGGEDGALLQTRIGAADATRNNLISASRMRVDVPAVSGVVDVEVQRDDLNGQATAVLTNALVVVPAATGVFGVIAVTPSDVDIAGDIVRVVGEGFTTVAVTEVSFGGTPGTDIQVVDDRQLTVRAPARAVGVVDVVVTRADASVATLPAALTYSETLRVRSVAPARGSAAGGTEVTVEGQAFGTDAANLDVRFGGIAATNVVLVDSNTLTCTTPQGAAGDVDVHVRRTDVDTQAVLRSGFLFEADVAVLGVQPSRGGMSGDTFVTIAGAGFVKMKRLEDVDTRMVAWFGDQPAITRTLTPEPLEVVVVNDSLITLRTPPGLPGRVDVRVGLYDINVNTAVNPPMIQINPVMDENGVTLEAQADDAFTYFDPTSVVGGTRGGPVEGAMYVTALDQATGLPIPDVAVFIGTDGAPTVADLTDFFGQATLSGPGVFGAQTVTLAKVGYETAVVPDVNAQEVTLYLISIGGGEGEGEGEPPPPPSELRGRVFGFAKEFFDPAALGPNEIALAFVNVTAADEFSSSPAQDGTVFEEGGEYELVVPPNRTGRMAIVATAGIFDLVTQEFRPRQMGLRREVFLEFGTNLIDQDVELTIPLDRDIDVSLPDAPLAAGAVDTRAVVGVQPTVTRVGAFLQLGGEGSVFLTLTHAASRNHAIASMPDVPGEMLTFLAGAYNTTGRNLFADDGTANMRVNDALVTGQGTQWAIQDPFTGQFLALGKVFVVVYEDGSIFASDVVAVQSDSSIRLRQRAPQTGQALSYHMGSAGPPSSEVFQDGVGDLRSGLTIQPVLGLPTLISPEENGAIIDRTLTWKAAPGQQPTLHQMYIYTLTPDQTAIAQLWNFYVDGGREKIIVPRIPLVEDLARALPLSEQAGLEDYVMADDFLAAPFFWLHTSIYTPGVSFENWSLLDIGGRGRRSWTEDQRIIVHGRD
jgi:hypothetical protein